MTDDNIKEVINRTSIVEIINSSVPLKKKGSNYFGLSPFKKEKTPSFSVNALQFPDNASGKSFAQ